MKNIAAGRISRSRRSATSRCSSAPRSAASSREGVIAAALTSLMILLFLGSWRSTLIIATSIPLVGARLDRDAVGARRDAQHHDLGGLALAVGILVDEATVTIENINWHLEQGKEVEQRDPRRRRRRS